MSKHQGERNPCGSTPPDSARPVPARLRRLAFAVAVVLPFVGARAAEMPEMWSSTAQIDPRLGRPDTRWFQEAKFGLFVHWGLYSAIGNRWHGRDYFGSGEWIMNRARIPAAEYAEAARTFDPTAFNAGAWAAFARQAGFRYVVVTAKHHEGFAMFDSKVSAFNIVAATPYHRDPMAALATACARDGLKFGFYYSQYLDWHEPDGGGNSWDFDPKRKDVKRYYAEKSIPQIKELLTNYGPLGLFWFDMPGGLSREETVAFMQQVRRLQPSCLISSRVGNGLGDFRDFGDSELPPRFIAGPWEALFTQTDSWGYVRTDRDFKTPREIIRLLASTAARGGNLLLNVGPDGMGRIPALSLKYLTDVGRWLRTNGDAIYGTTHGPIPDQPWGVTTLKPGRLFLHVFNRPADGRIVVPNINVPVTDARLLAGGRLKFERRGTDLEVQLPTPLPDLRDSVVEVSFVGRIADAWDAPALMSRQFSAVEFDAARASVIGATVLKSVTNSRYFGNWKHATCAVGMAAPRDATEFDVRFIEPGDYRVELDYACAPAAEGREGVVEVDGRQMPFETLCTGAYDSHEPLMLVRHSIGIVTIDAPGLVKIRVHPMSDAGELCWLRRLVLAPVD
ncbi:MAG TPA: alpha-L-fucosidase [Opitutaceae bacterium]|nr:alpha-L-fucosidase [Opitutaceae bacterium]